MAEAIIGLLILITLIVIYLIPTIIAERNKKRNSKAILVMNLFLGWTLIGWVVALIWATCQDR